MIAANPAAADSEWLEAAKLFAERVRELCERAGGITMLARMQMISAGDERWRRLSRENLRIERFGMGTLPLDPGKCYVYALAGREPGEAGGRTAFEVRDFASNAERTAVMVLGWAHPLPDPQ
jgi:hypothetical protein